MLLLLCVQDFGGQLRPTTTVFNTVDPFGDAGALLTMFNPSNLFPVLMILALFGGFVVAWICSIVIDYRNVDSIGALREKHVLIFGEIVPGWGKEDVRATTAEVLGVTLMQCAR